MPKSMLVAVTVLMMSSVLFASNDEKLPAPLFKGSLVCSNGKADSGSYGRLTMAKIESGVRITTGTLTIGVKGAVSEIIQSYRGQKDGHDVYHISRKFPADTDAAKTTEVDVDFDGKRQVLFQDQSRCIVVETQPTNK